MKATQIEIDAKTQIVTDVLRAILRAICRNGDPAELPERERLKIAFQTLVRADRIILKM
jgi:hypothetical protein